MKQPRTVEQWRRQHGYSYQALGDLLGCTRQYARTLCTKGTAGINIAVRLLAIAGGELELADLLSIEDRRALRRAGFLGTLPEDEPDNLI